MESFQPDGKGGCFDFQLCPATQVVPIQAIALKALLFAIEASIEMKGLGTAGLIIELSTLSSLCSSKLLC